MNYDLYATIPCQNKNAVDAIVDGHIDGQTIPDIYTRVQLLAPALLREERWNRDKGKDYAHGKYRNLVSQLPDHTQTKYATELIAKEKQRLEQLGLWQPNIPDLSILPPNSAFIQFKFSLASPYISRDDEIFHINDNPVRKDKLFKVPMMSGSAWKGNLRWTATHLLVLQWLQTQDSEQLADSRVRLTLLFGNEVGADGESGLTKYLDDLSTEAASIYRQKVRTHFSQTGRQSNPNHKGYLNFYPTFFDLISLEVINPHDRTTRTGKQPIYFESVPVGASGVFSLLYVPFNEPSEADIPTDLMLISKSISEMMLTYGFSAKKSSGFGEATNDIQGTVVTAQETQQLTSLATLTDEVNHVQCS